MKKTTDNSTTLLNKARELYEQGYIVNIICDMLLPYSVDGCQRLETYAKRNELRQQLKLLYGE